MKQILAVILVSAFAAVATEASADNKFCYWNAEGLPYSKTPPPDAEEALFPGGPMRAILVLFTESPQLPYQQACGLIGDAQLVKPREAYMRWGCSPESSVAQMVEGLASGGVLVVPGMSYIEYVTNKYPEAFGEHCQLLKGIEPICYLVSGDSPSPKDMERYPQCNGVWPKIKEFEEFWEELAMKESTVARELSKQDRDLIESAAVD